MTEKDLVFYMGGDVHYRDKVIANLKVDGFPLKYLVEIEKEKFFYDSRQEAVKKIIDYIEQKND